METDHNVRMFFVFLLHHYSILQQMGLNLMLMFTAFKWGPCYLNGPGFDSPQRRDRRLPSFQSQRHAGERL